MKEWLGLLDNDQLSIFRVEANPDARSLEQT